MLGVLFALSLAAVPASAGPDDDIDLDDDPIDIDESDEPVPAPKPPRPEPAPAPPPPDDADEEDDDLEDFRETGDDVDILGDEDEISSSSDTEQVYRAALAKLSKLGPDEEMAGWEAYLAQYSDSVYRTRIEHRIEELEDLMYGQRIGGTGDGTVDASQAELRFAHPLQLENIDPRTRISAAFEWGLPDYMNLVADYEHAIVRNFSAHGGIRRRYLGWNVEAGVHWALVKSLRTKMLVTVLADFRANTNPVYPGFRPQLAVGKRFGIVDAMVQAGPDLTIRTFADAGGKPTTEFQPLYTGGLNLFFSFSERVGGFLETSLYVKSVADDGAFDGGLFQFDVATFGLKFFPGEEGKPKAQEVNFGATVPYAQQWWQFHYGSIMGQFDYYL